jgi:para-aminobenzoate synthetase component 1
MTFKGADILHRNKADYHILPSEADVLKTRILNWAKQFSILVFLDNNSYPTSTAGYECLMAAGAVNILSSDNGNTLDTLQQTHDAAPDWMFGHICYEYKDILEPKLSSQHPVIHEFPALHFFIPETVCSINHSKDTLTIETIFEPPQIYAQIMECSSVKDTGNIPALSFVNSVTHDEYISTISRLRQHISDGDCYEINYCTMAHARCDTLNTTSVFHALNRLSPAPFAAYLRLHEHYLMCASPERYLTKNGRHILSQPIKGTARRDADPQKDEQIKNALATDIKERAENIMIVDLVRNDLARCCDTGTVNVDELFGIYSFPQVHQMISTVSGTMKQGVGFTEAIRTTFPMGSMTGAPKYKVTQLIDQYETARRELFSGTIGYITPSGNFDFNVIIRSLFYNEEKSMLSYSTGGAITWDSKPESEWEEMRLKAWALERIFK